MLSFLKKRKQLLPEEEFYQNAYYIPGGYAAFKGVWTGRDINGDVICTDDLLLEKDAAITGDIFCRKAHIKGTVRGNVYAWEELLIDEEASVFGNITSRFMQIVPGVTVTGKINMPNVVAIPGRVLDINRDNLKKYTRFDTQPDDMPAKTMTKEHISIPAQAASASFGVENKGSIEKATVTKKASAIEEAKIIADLPELSSIIINPPSLKKAPAELPAAVTSKPVAVEEVDSHWW